MSKTILIAIALLLVVAAGLYYFLVMQKSPQLSPLEREKGLGSELLQNPGTLVPETNPFQNTDTNPLKGTNPFEGGYKNPFGE
jgi:flagellar basal body-associated protein FliL